MTSFDELEGELVAREREFMLSLLPFIGLVIPLAIVCLGTISIGEITAINLVLAVVIVLVGLFLFWKFGHVVRNAHRRMRAAQVRLERVRPM